MEANVQVERSEKGAKLLYTDGTFVEVQGKADTFTSISTNLWSILPFPDAKYAVLILATGDNEATDSTNNMCFGCGGIKTDLLRIITHLDRTWYYYTVELVKIDDSSIPTDDGKFIFFYDEGPLTHCLAVCNQCMTDIQRRLEQHNEVLLKFECLGILDLDQIILEYYLPSRPTNVTSSI